MIDRPSHGDEQLVFSTHSQTTPPLNISAMPITIHPATPSDAPTFAHINIMSYQSDALHATAFGVLNNLTPEQQKSDLVYRTALFERNLNMPNVHWIKAVDDATGCVVGYAGWVAPEDSNVQDADEDLRDLGTMPTHINRSVLDLAEAKMADAKLRMLGDRKDLWCQSNMSLQFTLVDAAETDLGTLTVLPAYQRRGIAQKLTAYGLELADADGERRDIYLESTPVARKLYERNRFEVVEKIGILDGYSMFAMLRKSRK